MIEKTWTDLSKKNCETTSTILEEKEKRCCHGSACTAHLRKFYHEENLREKKSTLYKLQRELMREFGSHRWQQPCRSQEKTQSMRAQAGNSSPLLISLCTPSMTSVDLKGGKELDKVGGNTGK